MAIGPVTGRPFPWLLIRQLVTCEHVTLIAEVTVYISIVSTMTRLTVERSIDRSCYSGQNNDGGYSRVARQLSPQSGYVRLDGVRVTMIVLKHHNRDHPLATLIPSPGQMSRTTTASTYYLK